MNITKMLTEYHILNLSILYFVAEFIDTDMSECYNLHLLNLDNVSRETYGWILLSDPAL